MSVVTLVSTVGPTGATLAVHRHPGAYLHCISDVCLELLDHVYVYRAHT